MKAMLLAAGAGTRLRPLTDKTPKVLIKIGGVPLLETIIRRLINAGVDELIINTHHLAGQVADFLKAKNNFGIRMEISYESELLDTGGGLKKAAWFFDDGKPFLLHNGDIVTHMDLRALLAAHEHSGNLATLAVSNRFSTRHLIFDGAGRLCGHESAVGTSWAGGAPCENARKFAFNVVHAVSPELLPLISETGAFSILTPYLRLAGEGKKIGMFDASRYDWIDIGRPETLEKARLYVQQNGLPQ